MSNISALTIAIISNQSIADTSFNDDVDNSNCCTIDLSPVMLINDTFKTSFYPCGYYAPNEFCDITYFTYYDVVKRTDCTEYDCSYDTIDCSANDKYYNDVMIPIDCSNIEVSENPLYIYPELIGMFMSYNNLSCELAVNPKLKISLMNEVLSYKEFSNIPYVIESLRWDKIADWLFMNDEEDNISCFIIEYHHYDIRFMPVPVKFIFRYYVV